MVVSTTKKPPFVSFTEVCERWSFAQQKFQNLPNKEEDIEDSFVLSITLLFGSIDQTARALFTLPVVFTYNQLIRDEWSAFLRSLDNQNLAIGISQGASNAGHSFVRDAMQKVSSLLEGEQTYPLGGKAFNAKGFQIYSSSVIDALDFAKLLYNSVGLTGLDFKEGEALLPFENQRFLGMEFLEGDRQESRAFSLEGIFFDSSSSEHDDLLLARSSHYEYWSNLIGGLIHVIS